MELPRFLFCDNTDFKDAIFILHMDYPRFIINLVDDEIEWLESLERTDEEQLSIEVAGLIEEASAFYDREMERYDS